MKPVASMLTGLTEGIEKRQSPPEGGSNAGRTAAVTSPVDTEKLAAWLAGQKPSVVDSLAVSRASQLGVDMTVRTDFVAVKSGNGRIIGYHTPVRGVDVTGTDEARQAVSASLDRLKTPATVPALEAWLAELSVITRKRQDDEFSESLRLTAYASRLSAYPADIARAALMDRAWTFWPSWSELHEECERLYQPRRAMLAAVSLAPPERYGQEMERVSAKRAQEIIDEVWGAE